MRKASKPPSEWLNLLCKDWASENEVLVATTDAKFLDYKPFLKGMLTSQLLCRLSIPSKESGVESSQHSVDFWRILGVEDEFDKCFIIAQVERFCSLYNIRGLQPDESSDALAAVDLSATDHAALVAAAAGVNLSPGGSLIPMPAAYMDQATAAAAAAVASVTSVASNKRQTSEVSKAHKMAKDAEKALENERRQNQKREQRRVSLERKEHKAREREAQAIRKATERAQREATREERRRKKLEIRLQREQFAQEQKDAALKRAAELVASNRVPIEITRGAAAAKAAANAAIHAAGGAPVIDIPDKKRRSAIVVSTAGDLNAIVTHSKNLWAKYNAIAKEHNQKVNWITVAKELGIHVKVREKYARMHSRAEQRNFDWEKNADWKIKDHPEIFLEPTQAEQKAKMPPPPPPDSATVLIDGTKEVTDQALAAAAAVVDASVTSTQMDAVVQPNDVQTAAAVAATLVADPTAGLHEVDV